MKKIDYPRVNVESIVDRCLSSLRKVTDRLTLSALKNTLITAEANFFLHGVNNSLYRIKKKSISKSKKKLLKKIYKTKLAHHNGNCRDLYDEIMIQCPSYCPYCETSQIKSLDHFLPKSKFPLYSITPINLIPACDGCNEFKGSMYASTQGDQLINPYFDETDSDVWLYAELNYSKAVVVFSARPAPSFDAIIASKIINTFNILHLAPTYTLLGTSEISRDKAMLQKKFDNFGMSWIKDYYTEKYYSNLAISKNSLYTALYRELSSSIHFCNGGFMAFP